MSQVILGNMRSKPSFVSFSSFLTWNENKINKGLNLPYIFFYSLQENVKIVIEISDQFYRSQFNLWPNLWWVNEEENQRIVTKNKSVSKM